MNDIECPYCGHGFDICNDDGFGLDEDQIYQQECPECEKTFVFTACLLVSYTPKKADCLNGAPHNYQLTHTYPREYARMECTVCGERDLSYNPHPGVMLS